MGNDLITHGAVILPVSDLPASLSFYKLKLGFEITFQWNDPVEYVILKKNDFPLHFTKREDEQLPSRVHPVIYLFTNNVNSLYKELIDKDVEIHTPLADREYGMRDFDIKDPEGYILSFGEEI